MKRILLVAKPWRGGLANYIYSALDELFPGQVEWMPTRPITLAGQLKYRKNKKKWELSLVEKLAARTRDLAFFINHLPSFSNLDYHPSNLLWLTDGPNPTKGDYAPYGKVFLSDPGYLENVANVLAPGQLGGELGFGYSPEVHCWKGARNENKELCFIGNKDPKRDSYIKALLQSKVDCSIVGNYFLRHPLFWQHARNFSPSVDNGKMGQIYANHKISLNLHAQVVRQGTNMRTFECAGYGIPQLVEYRPGIEKYFEPDREIVTFSDPTEMLEKMLWLLDDSESRKNIAKAAKQRTLSEHSYQQRLERLLG
jgi:hypothetical protein